MLTILLLIPRKRKEVKMLEITFEHKDIFELFKENEHVYKDGVYDFTFEGRFAIYHTHHRNELVYIALDMETGYGSEVTVKQNGVPYTEKEYPTLIPLILNSIKYTGDRRGSSITNSDPIELIDYIFKTVMPRYGYKLRNEQMVLSKAMYESISERLVGICEAEVGCGKTLAYLIATAVARNRLPSYRMGYPITVVTSSIELQNSITEKDIPRLSDMLYEYGIIYKPLKVVLRKGKEHYMCYLRYKAFMMDLKQHPIKNKNIIEYFTKHDFEHKGFDLDKTKLPIHVKEKICAKGVCTRCKHRSDCRYGSFLYLCQNDSDIDIQVTNHNLYLASRKSRSEILKSSSFVVIDEAHKFKDAALDIFGTRISQNDVKEFIWATRAILREQSIEQIYKYALEELKFEAKTLFASIKKYAVEEDNEDKNAIAELTPRERMRIEKIIVLLVTFEKNKDIKDSEYKYWCKTLIEAFDAFLHPHALNVWVEKSENGDIELCATYKNIGKILNDKVWSKEVPHILTSGTMSDGKSFDYFKAQNGISMLRSHQVSEKTTPSPFNYKENTRLYIPKDMPTPDNTESYYKAIADRVVDLVNATNGHTAVLFTSYKMLWAVYDMAKDRLKKYELFVMTRGDNMSIKKFKESKNGVLFASGAMWEGVDCAGDCLSSVIITRLPFPIRNAITEQKKKESNNITEFISTYVVPEMIIKLRQGVGRLIRTENDTGVISILDSRATDGFYADKIAQVLKKYPRVSSIEEVETFIKNVKGKGYFDN